MRSVTLSILALITACATHAVASPTPTCETEIRFQSASGRALIDCRIEGAAAQARYESLTVPAELFRDADGGPGGYRKVDSYNYCYASPRLEVFGCSQTLDANSPEILPRDAALN